MSKPIFLILCLGVAAVLIAGGIIFATTREGPTLFREKNEEQGSLLPKSTEEGEAVSLATQTPVEFDLGMSEETDQEGEEPPATQASEVPPDEPESQATLKPVSETTQPSEPAPKPKTKLTTYTVSIGASSFVPQLLTIHAGDKVCWVNNDTQLHWPASDPHPTHTGFPDLDPLADLLPGETFCYTFTQLGVVSYHDHTQAVINDVATITGGVRILARE